jgi:hypothetical protein
LAVTDDGGLRDFDEVTVTVNDVEEGGGGEKKMCFIATAAFGPPLENEVAVLQEMRDRYLLRSGAGRAFVAFYYRHSPPLAKYVSEHRAVRALARAGLYPIVGVSYVVLKTTLLQKLIIALFFAIVFAAASLIVLMSERRRGQHW